MYPPRYSHRISCSSFHRIATSCIMLCGTHVPKYAPFLNIHIPCTPAKILRNLEVTNICTLKTEKYQTIYYPNHWSSFRPISIGQLNISLCLHLRPINVIVSHESYLKGGNLFLWGASHLDAFSAYPVRR